MVVDVPQHLRPVIAVTPTSAAYSSAWTAAAASRWRRRPSGSTRGGAATARRTLPARSSRSTTWAPWSRYPPNAGRERRRAEVVSRLQQPGVGPPPVRQGHERGAADAVPQLVVRRGAARPRRRRRLHRQCAAATDATMPARCRARAGAPRRRPGGGDQPQQQVDVEVRPDRRRVDVHAAARPVSPVDGRCRTAGPRGGGRRRRPTGRSGRRSAPPPCRSTSAPRRRAEVSTPTERWNSRWSTRCGLSRSCTVCTSAMPAASQARDPPGELVGAEVLEPEVEVHDVDARGDERVHVPDRRSRRRTVADQPEVAQVRVVRRVLDDTVPVAPHTVMQPVDEVGEPRLVGVDHHRRAEAGHGDVPAAGSLTASPRRPWPGRGPRRRRVRRGRRSRRRPARATRLGRTRQPACRTPTPRRPRARTAPPSAGSRRPRTSGRRCRPRSPEEQVAEVLDAVTEAGPDLLGEVPLVVARDRPAAGEDRPGGPRRWRGGAPSRGPTGRSTPPPRPPGPGTPRSQVDPVADDVADRDTGPRRRVGVRHRDEHRRVALLAASTSADSSHGVGGECSVPVTTDGSSGLQAKGRWWTALRWTSWWRARVRRSTASR